MTLEQIKATHMSLYPTRDSLLEAVQYIEAELDDATHRIFPLLMMYHNTLLAELERQTQANEVTTH